jgi:hypothetical protein
MTVSPVVYEIVAELTWGDFQREGLLLGPPDADLKALLDQFREAYPARTVKGFVAWLIAYKGFSWLTVKQHLIVDPVTLEVDPYAYVSK